MRFLRPMMVVWLLGAAAVAGAQQAAPASPANPDGAPLSKGEISPEKETLVRVHEPLSVLDFLDPCGGQHTFSLDQAQAALARAESGVIVLLRRPELPAVEREFAQFEDLWEALQRRLV